MPIICSESSDYAFEREGPLPLILWLERYAGTRFDMDLYASESTVSETFQDHSREHIWRRFRHQVGTHKP